MNSLCTGAVGRRPLLRVDLKKLNDPARDRPPTLEHILEFLEHSLDLKR